MDPWSMSCWPMPAVYLRSRLSHTHITHHFTSAALAACHVESKPLPRDGIMPTKLYCKNANVDAENSAHLAKLPGAPVRLPATDTFKVSLTLTLTLALTLSLTLTLTLTLYLEHAALLGG